VIFVTASGIFLPALSDPHIQSAEVGGSVKVVASAKNIVLVVDDELEARRMATQALSEAGFRAEVADNGNDGLKLFTEHSSEICLVLSDVVMPVMDGLRMVEKIVELDPEMKVMFMTGYSQSELQILTKTRFPIIRKPFLAGDLIQSIQSMFPASRQTLTAN
jgi:CheY-like chemotaxis protein